MIIFDVVRDEVKDKESELVKDEVKEFDANP